MVTVTRSPLPDDTVRQLHHILRYIYNDGRKWLRDIAVDDWRRQYASGRSEARRARRAGPTMDHFSPNVEHLLGYIAKPASNETAEAHEYHFVVRPEKACADDKRVAIIRPVLKTNFSNESVLNFHIWFHGIAPAGADEHLVFGLRLEGPEGSDTRHDYYHAQPLKKFGRGQQMIGMPSRYPEAFPTIPLPASNPIELCLTALLIACGKDSLRGFMRQSGDPDVRKCTKEFWARIFAKQGKE